MIAALCVAGITLVGYRWLHLNPTTLALAYLLGVLGMSASWGLRQAVFMSVIATLAFNYFFLPPIGTFTIADPQNWIALFAFLVTAVTASELSERARRGARSAIERRQELERLYAFSQLLLSSDNPAELLNLIPRYIVDSFGIRSAAVCLSSRNDVYRSGPTIDGLESSDLQLICVRGEPRFDAAQSIGLHAAPHGHARGRLHGRLRFAAFAANSGGHRQPGGHRHRARGRRRKTQPRRGRPRKRAIALRPARFGRP